MLANMHYYCHLSSGSCVDTTNLQLYSLQQAAACWNELVDLGVNRVIDATPHPKEQLAFILNCLGLSLSQLLGQNCPSPEKEKMGQPGDLLSAVLERDSIDKTTKRRLNSTFKDFMSYYGAVRHFGINKGEENYQKLDRLTVKKLDLFRRMTIEIWDIVLAMYRNDEENEIEIETISEVVQFSELVQHSY